MAGRGGGIPQGEVSTDNPAAKRGVPAIIVSILGLCQIVAGLVIERSKGGAVLSGLNTIWGYMGFILLVGGFIWWLIVGWTTRCPFCNQRIPRRSYPRPGYFCPKCGKTVAS